MRVDLFAIMTVGKHIGELRTVGKKEFDGATEAYQWAEKFFPPGNEAGISYSFTEIHKRRR
jgi:hypothetical protein